MFIHPMPLYNNTFELNIFNTLFLSWFFSYLMSLFTLILLEWTLH